MLNLSPEQNEIVEDWLQNKGAMLVAASAGSGKTRILTECIRRLIEESPKERSRILCLTFTNKAAEEMKQRMEVVNGIKDRTFIGTIHSFGLEVIRSYRHELGYFEMPHILERESDRKEILKKVFEESPILKPILINVKDNFKPELNLEDRLKEHQINLISNTLEWISNQKKKLIYIDDEISEYKNWKEEHLQVFKLYNQYLRNQNLIEFDDILLLAWLILEKPNVKFIYQRLYKYVLIDEAQDLNFAQYELLKSFCISASESNGETRKEIVVQNILMVGDSNQAIHGYTGADKKYMLNEFVIDFNARKGEIRKNYRSSKSVLKIANEIYNSTEIDLDSFHFNGYSEILSFENETKEAEWIIKKIKGLLTEKPIEFDTVPELNQIAVLARTKYVFSELQKQLREDEQLSKHFFLKKGSDAISPESTLMKVFDLGTRIMANNKAEVYWNQLKMLLKIKDEVSLNSSGYESLFSLKSYIDYDYLDFSSNHYDLILESCSKINKNISSFNDALNLIEADLSKIENEDERNNTHLDLEEWKEAWNSYIRNSSNRTLADFRRFTAMGFNRNQQDVGLTLATVHTMKGLEFDVVFVIGFCNGTFPDYRAMRSNGKAMEEERNNAYVAITRAKRHIYLTYPRKKKMPWGSEKKQVPSVFLNGIEINHICS